MMMTKPSLGLSPGIGSFLGAVRGKFGKANQSDLPEVVKTGETIVHVSDHERASMEQSRDVRIMEHEIDRVLLTEVEREDSDMLGRVRAALYEK